MGRFGVVGTWDPKDRVGGRLVVVVVVVVGVCGGLPWMEFTQIAGVLAG